MIDPVAISLGPLQIRWYGILVAVGFLVGMGIARRNARRVGMDEAVILDLFLLCVVGGILGARLFYVVQFWHEAGFDRHPWEIIRVDHGGLVFFGGFLFVMAGMFFYCLARRAPVLGVMDACAPSLAVGHAFGRIGCYINGCCHGKPMDASWWSISYPAENLMVSEKFRCLPLHPVQLYESLANVAVFAFTIWLFNRPHRKGAVAGLYLILYAAARFSLEFARGDHNDFLFPALRFGTEAQVIAVCAASAGLWLMLRKSETVVKAPNPTSKATTQNR